MEIRDAEIEDAQAACAVMRRSITELCIADHKGNASVLRLWLGNKTPDDFRSWMSHPENTVVVAIEAGSIIGVGAVNGIGEITLNYVAPDARFRGVSRAILGALESRATKRGSVRCTLTSTETALRFYRAHGYVETGPSANEFGMSGYPMSKALTRGDS